MLPAASPTKNCKIDGFAAEADVCGKIYIIIRKNKS